MEKGKIDKKNLTLLLILVVPAIILVLVLVLSKENVAEEAVNEVPTEEQNVPIPDASEVKTEGKLSQYLKEQEAEYQRKMKENQEGIDQSDVFFDEVVSDEKSESKNAVVESEPEKPREEKSASRGSSYSSRKAVAKTNTEEVKEAVVEKPKEEEVYRSSMGIVESSSSKKSSAGKSSSSDVSSEAGIDEPEFIPVVLEQDVRIKNGSVVVFILKNDMELTGGIVKKNSYVYCKATMMSDRCYLDVTKIKGTDGRIFSPKKIAIYDEKYTKGLEYDGKVDNAAKEAASEQTNETSTDINSGNIVLDNGVDLLKKTIRKSAKTERTVTVSEGYRVFIKKED